MVNNTVTSSNCTTIAPPETLQGCPIVHLRTHSTRIVMQQGTIVPDGKHEAPAPCTIVCTNTCAVRKLCTFFTPCAVTQGPSCQAVMYTASHTEGQTDRHKVLNASCVLLGPVNDLPGHAPMCVSSRTDSSSTAVAKNNRKSCSDFAMHLLSCAVHNQAYVTWRGQGLAAVD